MEDFGVKLKELEGDLKMILTNNSEEVKGTITTFQTEGFKIANTAHMMEILSKRLYTNPTKAVCRELVCNAIDAHVAAGNTQKVDVWLPCLANDYRFIVKDYGTGLSEEDVMNLYTTYGMSSKQNSNAFIGALGIGSKSPFAVTGEFSVVSRYNGVATTYHCYKQKGLPVCTKLSSVKTDEHNGMTITVPFTMDNYRHFVEQAHDFFKGVDESLVDTHEETVFWNTSNFTFNYKGLHIVEGWCAPSRVRMGQVLYNVPSEWAQEVAGGSAITLEVPIGTFAIAANRENIEDNSENRQKFIDEVKKVVKDYVDSFDLDKYNTFSSLHKLFVSTRFSIFEDLNRRIEEKCTAAATYYWDTVYTFYKNSGKYYSHASDYYINYQQNRDCKCCCIVKDVEPIVKPLLLVNAWDKTCAVDYYFILKSKGVPRFAFKTVFMSQLNEWYEYLKKQNKRRAKNKSAKKPSEDFTVWSLNGYGICSKYSSKEDFKNTSEVPYIVFKGREISEATLELIGNLHKINVRVYGIAETNKKYIRAPFIPLPEYLKKHNLEANNLKYHTTKRNLIDAFRRCGKNFWKYNEEVITPMFESVAFERVYHWMPDRELVESFSPVTDNDKRVKELLLRVQRVAQKIEELNVWCRVGSFEKAPDMVKEFVRSQLMAAYKGDKEVSSESTSTTL